MSMALRLPAAAVAEPWLSVIGIGDDGVASLSDTARALLDAAEVLVGGSRHLAMVADHPAERRQLAPALVACTDVLFVASGFFGRQFAVEPAHAVGLVARAGRVQNASLFPSVVPSISCTKTRSACRA